MQIKQVFRRKYITLNVYINNKKNLKYIIYFFSLRNQKQKIKLNKVNRRK